MAISWGAWEGASPNRIRVGLDVTWADAAGGAIDNSTTQAKATVDIWVDVEGNWADNQTLSFGGYISGSVSFANNQNNNAVQRATRTYTYTYPSGSYGTSPADRRFTASLSGAFNGATPSKVVDSPVKARPYAAPLPPTNVSASRVSDTATKVSWTNRDTDGRPWSRVYLQRALNGSTSWATVSTSISGSASSYTYASAANTRYTFRVAADNSVGTSSYTESTTDIWTSPAAPSAATRTGANGANQTVTWSNSGMGYSDYSTEVWRADNGVWGSSPLFTVAGPGTSSPADTYPAANPGIKFKYRVRHRTTQGNQGVLYSAWSGETTETAGVTIPPEAPTGLAPGGGITVDPSLNQTFIWTRTHPDGSAQQKFQVRHRPAGAASWTTTAEVVDPASQWVLPADTYLDKQTVEWQVRTWSSSYADPSPWSEPASFVTALSPVAADPVKVPVQMDLSTGQLEASFTASETRDYTMRAQTQMSGGGTKTVTAAYSMSWTDPFVATNFGRSASTFYQGYHNISQPYGWSTTGGTIGAGGLATLNLTVTTNNQRLRVGDQVAVTGSPLAALNNPVDQPWTVRSVSTSTVTLETGLAPQSVASGGAVFPVILGHGGAPNTNPVASSIYLNSWEALYYELPYGWGSGDTARKNGVVAISSASYSGTSLTLTVPPPHYFTIGDSVTVSGLAAPYSQSDLPVISITENTVTVTVAGGAAGSVAVPAGSKVHPSGKDTFFGNFHKVGRTADFVIPSTWILLCVRNGTSARFEWITGESMAADTQQGGGWVPFPFKSGWSGSAGYRVIGDQVFIRGSATRDSGTGVVIATLPTYARPSYTSYFSNQRYSGSTSGMNLSISISTGDVGVGTYTTGESVYLSGITYLNS